MRASRDACLQRLVAHAGDRRANGDSGIAHLEFDRGPGSGLARASVYEEAVKTFAPYDRVREVNEPVRGALRELVEMARVDGRPAFIFVNNRLEGNSPGTIVAITE